MEVGSPKRTGRRKAAVAAALSVIPGVGQMYAGQWRRGAVLLIGLPAQAALFYGVQMPWLGFGLALVWLWGIYDASRAARGAAVAAAWPVVVIIFLNLVAAWKVTDIHAPKLQAEQRTVIGQIIAGLGKPDFAARQTTEQKATGKYVVPGAGMRATTGKLVREQGKPWITVAPMEARVGQRLAVTGIGFAAGRDGSIKLIGAEEMPVGRFRTGRRGDFATTFSNPRRVPGVYYVQATVKLPAGRWGLSETLQDAAPRMFETIYLALIGTAMSLVLALPLSFLGARNLMYASPVLKAIYGATRALFTVLRSVEVLIIAVIAVAALGIGPFAGVLALAIHGIGALGKLYSEAIESIDHGPIEAIRSTGANDLQVVMYAVVPQVVPQFVAFTLYRWDINVRMATVIGLVGGGGIGAQLIAYMNLFQWRQAATAIWLIAAVVMLMDYASAVIRERLV